MPGFHDPAPFAPKLGRDDKESAKMEKKSVCMDSLFLFCPLLGRAEGGRGL
jgi:hypothetical protein